MELERIRLNGDIDLESLKDNEEFNTLILKISALVIQNHQKEKLECFRNIVINSIKGTANPNFDTKAMYMRLVDELTVSHLTILIFLDNPKQYFRNSEMSPPNCSNGIVALIVESLSAYCFSKDSVLRIVHELQNKGLINLFNATIIVKSHDYIKSYTTEWGRDFIEFISEN